MPASPATVHSSPLLLPTPTWPDVSRVWLAEARAAAAAAPSHRASSEPEPAESEQIRLDAHLSGRKRLGMPDEAAAAHWDEVLAVLHQWCALRHPLGYWQGVNLLAGAAVCVCGGGEDAAALLSLLLSRLPSPGGAALEVAALCHLLEARDPALFGRVSAAQQQLKAAASLAALQWLSACWASALPLSPPRTLPASPPPRPEGPPLLRLAPRATPSPRTRPRPDRRRPGWCRSRTS